VEAAGKAWQLKKAGQKRFPLKLLTVGKLAG